MPSQKERLDALAPSYQALALALQDGDLIAAQTSLIALGENIQGLDLRLINDDILSRVAEGSNRAIVALASKNAPKTLTNRNASNSVDGVLVNRETIFALFESIDFYENADSIGHVSPLFHTCLTMLTRMFSSATPEENAVLKAMAERAMLPETPSS